MIEREEEEKKGGGGFCDVKKIDTLCYRRSSYASLSILVLEVTVISVRETTKL